MNISASQGNIRAEESSRRCLHHWWLHRRSIVRSCIYIYMQQGIVLTTSWKSLDNLWGDRPRILDHYHSMSGERPTTISDLRWLDYVFPCIEDCIYQRGNDFPVLLISLRYMWWGLFFIKTWKQAGYGYVRNLKKKSYTVWVYRRLLAAWALFCLIIN